MTDVKHEIPEDLREMYESTANWDGRLMCEFAESHGIPQPWRMSPDPAIRRYLIERIAQLTADAHNLKSPVHAICNQNITETLAAALEQTQTISRMDAELKRVYELVTHWSGEARKAGAERDEALRKMTDVKHEIPEDLRELYEASSSTTAYQTAHPEIAVRADGRVAFKVRELIERIAQLTADLAECKRDFFEADSLRAKLTDDVERLTAELEIAKQDRNMYDSAHKREAVASLRLAAELVDVKAERDELKKARDLFARGLEAEEKDCEELHDQVEKLTAERDAALRECEHVIEERRLTLNKFAALEAELSRLKVPVSAEVKDYLDLAISSLCGDRIHFCTSNAQEKQHRRDAKNAQELVDFIANRSKPPEVTK